MILFSKEVLTLLPWVSRPVIDLDLDQPVEARYAALPPEVLADSAALLSEVMQQIPPSVMPQADLVRTRTRAPPLDTACSRRRHRLRPQ